MFIHLIKNLIPRSVYKRTRNFICILLALSFILSLTIPTYSGSDIYGYENNDAIESGSALLVEDNIEKSQTDLQDSADIVEDVETEVTSAYIDSETTEDNTFDKTLTAKVKGQYVITVKYNKDAGIPTGSVLNVTEVDDDKYINEAADTLGWTDDDYILYTKFFDISIVKNGEEIEPKSAVTVTAELLDVEENSEALQVVHFDEDGATAVESNTTDEAEVTFKTESFSVFGFGTALRSVMTEKNEFVDISLYSSWDELEFSDISSFIAAPEEGIETSKAFELSGNVQTSKLWVRAELGEKANLDDGEFLSLYSIKNDEAAEMIIEDISENSGLCSVGEDVSGVVLMKDTGLRHLSFDLKPTKNSSVSLDGLMPKNATANAIDVSEKQEEAILAYDISINNNGKDYQPKADNPIYVEITDSKIGNSGDIALIHIKDNGEYEKIEIIKQQGNKIGFNAAGFSVYEIVGYDIADTLIYEKNKDAEYVEVDDNAPGWQKVTDLSILTSEKYGDDGFYISSQAGDSVGRFAKDYHTDVKAKDRMGIAVTSDLKDSDGNYIHNSTTAEYREEIINAAIQEKAARYYFTNISENNYYVYCKKDGVNQYVTATKTGGNGLILTPTVSAASIWTLCSNKNTPNNTNISTGNIVFYNTDQNLCWNSTAKGNQENGFAAFDGGNNFNIWYEVPDKGSDPFKIAGTYALVNEQSDGTAYAMSTNFSKGIALNVQDNSGQKQYISSSGLVPKWTIDFKSANKYNFSIDNNGTTQYLKINTNNSIGLNTTIANNSDITVVPAPETSEYSGKIKLTYKSGNNQYTIYRTSDGKFVSGIDADIDEEAKWFTLVTLTNNDVYNLSGNTYGLMHHADGSTTANALMSDLTPKELKRMVIRANGLNNTYYVDENHEISKWTFTNVEEDKYKVSTTSGENTVYLAIAGDSLQTVTSAENATVFKVTAGTKVNNTTDYTGKIKLSSGGKYVTFTSAASEEDTDKFGLTSTASDVNTWIDLVDDAQMQTDEYITFSAHRVSISDVLNGNRVIVYIRVWNETDLKYDMYAVDYDGTLYPCYASGGKIMWLGNNTGSLEWEFTEYYDAATKEPNYYYELYNPYSELYIAPQLGIKQVLSPDKIGINLPGRKNGEFYSNIIAWDKSQYAYISLKPNEDKTKLVPCSQSASIPFYFASMEEINYDERLHPIETIDNTQHGITMKMIDYPDVSANYNGVSANSDKASSVTQEFGLATGRQKGLLSTDLKANGYPVVAKTSTDFSGAFSGAENVNHLFTESVYNSSGYFEFDSCQTFATLCEYKDEETFGLKPIVDGYRNFTVYKELGSHDQSTKDSLKHGQFYPYDIIKEGKYTNTNKQNLYSALATTGNNADAGKLDETDPRKYELLHKIQTHNDGTTDYSNDADYYFGMEMSASFTQTVSGLDAWDHDIIFEFRGDDDFWLYVDGELVLDLGGTHSAIEGKVNFRTGTVTYDTGTTHSNGSTTTNLREIFTNNFKTRNPSATQAEIDAFLAQYFAPGENIFKDYSKHEMKIFYMERGAGASNLYMRFNIASVTPGQVVVNKAVTGDGADELDLDFVEYPFQIYYTIKTGVNEDTQEAITEERLLGNGTAAPGTNNIDEYIMVKYQNTNQQVPFVEKYIPPGVSESETDKIFRNVYFINPKKSAVIHFPEDAISYRIVECAVDTSLYTVKINGETPKHSVAVGSLMTYWDDESTVKEMPILSFDNEAKAGVVRTLRFKKNLYDENDNIMTYYSAKKVEEKRQELMEANPSKSADEIQDMLDSFMTENKYDSSTFSFRLYISSNNVAADEIPYADMYRYYVLSPNGKLCSYDSEEAAFAEVTSIDYDAKEEGISDDEYSKQIANSIIAGTGNYGISVDDVIFNTSGFGAISGIPAGYTVYVPGLPVNSVFKVTEDDLTGYGLRDDSSKGEKGYQHIPGQRISEGVITEFASYIPFVEGQENIGRVTSGQDPLMYINNKKGYGLTVQKNWSDLALTTYHDPIYVAVYVDGTLLAGSVKKIESPNTKVYYFWSQLAEKDGNKRTTLEGYEVKEVVVTGDNIEVDAAGNVTNYSSITVKNSGAEINLNCKDLEKTTQNYNYVVSYTKGEDNASSRADVITNTREGGLQIRLFKWNTTVPLEDGKFKLTDSSGNVVGTYTSLSDGTVTVLYDFNKNEKYTLEQTSAPKGYVGMQKKLVFSVNDSKGISLYYDDKTTAWGTTDPVDLNWANSKAGENGIDGFIDIYNKTFTFKIMKTDSENSDLALNGAHFALFKQVNTIIGGLLKNQSPMLGFEDMYNENPAETNTGEIVVAGGDSGRTLNPGTDGSTYFLTEILAPDGYTKLLEDIIFSLSPLGIPTLVRDIYNGSLVEQDDCYVYTLSVPNTKAVTESSLTITKTVEGNMGNKYKDFPFTISVEGADGTEEYSWSKNGVEQGEKLKSGSTFLMRNDDTVIIILPKNSVVTITEQNEDYKTKFKLNGGDEEEVNEKTFSLTNDNVELNVTNIRSAVLPTGIIFNFALLLKWMSVIAFAVVILFLRQNKRAD